MANVKRRKLWALTAGSYSDYQVHALFPTKKLAEAGVEAHNKDKEAWIEGAQVETLYLYDEVPEPTTSWKYQAELWDDGLTTNEYLDSTTALPWNHLRGEAPKRPKVRYVRAPIYNNKGGRLEVYGSDEQAVKQAFSDNKARIRDGQQ
jgi:hypothetical protein